MGWHLRDLVCTALACGIPTLLLMVSPPAVAGGVDGGVDASPARACSFSVSGAVAFTGRCVVQPSVRAADGGKWRYNLLIRDSHGPATRRLYFSMSLPDGFKASPPPDVDILYLAEVTNDAVEWWAGSMSVGTLSVTLDPATVRDEKFRDPHGRVDATLECSNLPAPAQAARVVIDF